MTVARSSLQREGRTKEGGGARCIYGTGETFNYQLGALCTCDYRATGSEAYVYGGRKEIVL